MHARNVANEESVRFPKTLELEQRLAKLELSCNDFAQALASIKKHLTALQAQLDHTRARMDR